MLELLLARSLLPTSTIVGPARTPSFVSEVIVAGGITDGKNYTNMVEVYTDRAEEWRLGKPTYNLNSEYAIIYRFLPVSKTHVTLLSYD